MVLLIITALLFLFLTTFIGFYLNRFLFAATNTSSGTFADLLSGTAAITVFLNIASVFFPTNYLLLIPVCFFALLIAFKTNYKASFTNALQLNLAILFYKSNAIVTCSFLLVLILFTLVPPYNTDSTGYHFLSILWIEKFKAVPGLANLFPQYGYNSSFFVLSAAFSFTNLTGQSVYSVNCVLTIAFFVWMLKKSYQLTGLNKFLIWLLLIILLRQFPINLASPSADALASIIVFYVLFTLFFKTSQVNQINFKFLILLSCFSLIIKLSTLPLLLIALLPFFIPGKKTKEVLLTYLKLLPVILVILVPWVIRNIILTGYVVFPFPAANFFSFDWKVSLDVVIAEKMHIAHAPRMVSDNWYYVNTLPFSTWFPIWLPKVWASNYLNFILVISGLLSPLLIVVLVFQKRLKAFSLPLWCIAYAGIVFWMISSPDIRFGYYFILPGIFFPLLTLTANIDFALKKVLLKYVVPAAVPIICFYYDVMAFKKLSPYPVSQFVIYPIRSPEYFKNNDLATFKYILLNNQIKLYIPDSAHNSINAPLPVSWPYRNGIKMRGNKLEDGFKTQL